MPWAVLDTSVYIDHWEAGRYEKELADVRRTFVVRHSAAVLSELRRGARTPIALTARRHGATVVTANRADFELLSRETGVAVLAL